MFLVALLLTFTSFASSQEAASTANKQAVVVTTAGEFVIDLRPDLAPNHVAYFIKLAQSGAYDGTTFHRMIKHGIIQGGDPLSKDPAKVKAYGTGGLGKLKAEFSSEPATRGAVAAVLVPGQPDSAGSQFFVCVTDQLALTAKYTIFGRVSEGLDVVTKISETPTSDDGRAVERVEITSVTIRDTPPPAPEPFSTESIEELAQYRAVLEVSGIHFGLQGDTEQEAIVGGFAAFLNSLSFPAQVLVRVLPIDIAVGPLWLVRPREASAHR